MIHNNSKIIINDSPMVHEYPDIVKKDFPMIQKCSSDIHTNTTILFEETPTILEKSPTIIEKSNGEESACVSHYNKSY